MSTVVIMAVSVRLSERSPLVWVTGGLQTTGPRRGQIILDTRALRIHGVFAWVQCLRPTDGFAVRGKAQNTVTDTPRERLP